MNFSEQAKRLMRLRAAMHDRNLAAYLVPRVDEHQNEYVAPSDERLAWISGFNGTAGFAVVGRELAALFVDGRYTLQAHKQSKVEFWEHRHVVDDSLDKWAQQNLVNSDRVGFDPKLHTPDEIIRLGSALSKLDVDLVAIEPNLIDLIWNDRPPLPRAPVTTYSAHFAGETSVLKRQRIAATLRDAKLDALVISALDNLAWLFNIRGADLEFTPFVFGYAILQSDATAYLFIDAVKLHGAVRTEIAMEGQCSVAIMEPSGFADVLASLSGLTLRLDRATVNVSIAKAVEAAGATVDIGLDPCTWAKACKNPAQLEGMRRAHHRDGVALVRFLHWFSGITPGNETEWTIAEKLAEFRSVGKFFRGLSFPTISAVAGNAAQAHYRLEKSAACALSSNEIYLVDSGAQYLDGTTDVTRVLIKGTPTVEMRERYTQILKGHIAVSCARFPAGTTGAQIDPLARQFLWASGVDFDHGTGHGVGCYLSVHEGPQGISKRATEVSLKPGMVVSVEPGYYKENAFGIRIENLVAVREAEPQPVSGELRVLEFETLTLVPYDRRLIDIALLTHAERDWIDAYHTIVREALTPALEPEDVTFLACETAPLQD
jgi:Xaa-Pro aminopeptidase